MSEGNDRYRDVGEAVLVPPLRGFSPVLTVLSLTICLMGLGVILWSTSLSDAPSFGLSSSRDLERLASRVLAFETSANHLSSFERFMYHLGTGEFDTYDDLLRWYRELLSEQPDVMNWAYVGILIGEYQDSLALRSFLDKFPEDTPLFNLLREALQVAYLGENNLRGYQDMQANLAEEMPGNWFYFRLAQRMAERAENVQLHSSLAAQLQRQTMSLILKWRLGLALELAILVLGGVGWVIYVKAQRSRVQTDLTFWTFGEGMAVLARGGALTVLSLGCLLVFPGGAYWLMEYGVLWLYLPVVLVAYGLLFRAHALSVQEVFGWSPFWAQLRTSAPVALMVLGLGLLGSWAMMILGDAIGYSVHWTEWFVPDLVWGSQAQVLKTLAEFVILAPFFEEVIFRGLLFPTLHVRFGRRAAILGSALLFAAAHGYGLVAFLTVLWSGILWGWAYSRTGSLLPGMVAHAVNNGLVAYTLLAFFR